SRRVVPFFGYDRSVLYSAIARIVQWPPSLSRRHANTEGASKRGGQYQYTEPFRPTREAG
ncbi:MAG: hypothetical protein AVDCRST_MAG25-2323, partial [uncultured Rubrobacteraceae bacterium]